MKSLSNIFDKVCRVLVVIQYLLGIFKYLGVVMVILHQIPFSCRILRLIMNANIYKQIRLTDCAVILSGRFTIQAWQISFDFNLIYVFVQNDIRSGFDSFALILVASSSLSSSSSLHVSIGSVKLSSAETVSVVVVFVR